LNSHAAAVVWGRVDARAVAAHEGLGVGADLCVVLDDGVEDVDGGGETDGGGHAGVGVAAFFDGEHLGAGLGLAEPEGELADGEAVVAGDGDEGGAGVAELGEDAVVEVCGDGWRLATGQGVGGVEPDAGCAGMGDHVYGKCTT
jgi:hypothetical protein